MENNKKKIEYSVQKQLSKFIRQKGLLQKSNRVINPIDLLRKVRLAKEFISKCQYLDSKTCTKEDSDTYRKEISKACNTIMNYYL